jgi:hypothetical protein
LIITWFFVSFFFSISFLIILLPKSKPINFLNSSSFLFPTDYSISNIFDDILLGSYSLSCVLYKFSKSIADADYLYVDLL